MQKPNSGRSLPVLRKGNCPGILFLIKSRVIYMWDLHRCYWAMALTEVLSAPQPLGVARYIKVIVSIAYDMYPTSLSESGHLGWEQSTRP